MKIMELSLNFECASYIETIYEVAWVSLHMLQTFHNMLSSGEHAFKI